MEERKLASIQTIDALSPIDGADMIDKARVMGWDIVVKKGEFSVGDRCVFFEIDSLLPEGQPWAEFMRPRGFRVKTARLRGTLSQGLALPTTILADAGDGYDVGRDVSGELGVIKFEPALPDTQDIEGPFPEDVPKTNEIRLQSALSVLEEMRGQEFVVTTKLDGTSVTYYRHPEGLVACSRNWAQRRSDSNPIWRIADELKLEDLLPPWLALQGELCGPGIQKNRLGLSKPTFFAFNAYDVRSGSHFDHMRLVELCHWRNIQMVPVERLVVGLAAASFDHSLSHYLAMASGYYEGTKNRKEGIVVRPLRSIHSATLGGRLSFKVISNEFLLKDED